ncbi:MAG: hypothetical protein H7A23_10835 [Leptospiraceae bacterium]|nr:hypothetical protein [Leptospiraceae bacterium]MCP5495040.1 hypothetical protein [Leptospiraceae bacterium]
MPYGTYKALDEIANKFDIEINRLEFLSETNCIIEDFFIWYIKKSLLDVTNYVSENSICETMISPILRIVLEKYDLPLWSHVRFDVSPEEGLTGIPDFLVAPATKTGLSFTNPVVCIAEVKKENFDEGWTQALCEMIAAQRFNKSTQKPIYGIATGGHFWQFGKLIEKQLVLDLRIYSPTMDLQRLFNALNWFFGEAKKTIDLPNGSSHSVGEVG